METLWNLYQKRLEELNDTFIQLLEEFQNNSLFTTPELSKYRVEYLADIIQTTLKNNQEKLILKLYQEIDQLKTVNLTLCQQLKQSHRQEQRYKQESQVQQKSLGSTKVSTVGNKKQAVHDSSDLFLQKGRNTSARKQTNHRAIESRSNKKIKQKDTQQLRQERYPNRKHNEYKKEQENIDEDEQMSMLSSTFKYLRL